MIDSCREGDRTSSLDQEFLLQGYSLLGCGFLFQCSRTSSPELTREDGPSGHMFRLSAASFCRIEGIQHGIRERRHCKHALPVVFRVIWLDPACLHLLQHQA